MTRTYKAAIAAAKALITLAAVGWASATTHAGFVGRKWLVASITSDGKQIPIPKSDFQPRQVYVRFTRGGRFTANDPVNTHSGTYRPAGDGFTTSGLQQTLAGYAGHDPVTLLAIEAISAFREGVHATATVTGNRLVISVGGFMLDCERDGPSGGGVQPRRR